MLKRQILLYAVLFLTNCLSIFATNQQQLTELMLREIGNDFLLELGDSTSRILPIEAENGLFKVRFDRDFSFNPEDLVSITRDAVHRLNVKTEWLVEVKTCDSLQVVHSFRVNHSKKVQGIACLLREIPEDCYFFSFTSLSEEIELFQKPTVTAESLPLTSSHLIFGAFTLLVITLGFVSFRKSLKQKKQIQYKKIGKFEFDEHKMTLTLNRQIIELSGKESELLNLLYLHKNKTLERDRILSEVWGDEGDYVGRTLDVFISKLRKKLSFDEEIEIINIRGIGYRLVVP